MKVEQPSVCPFLEKEALDTEVFQSNPNYSTQSPSGSQIDSVPDRTDVLLTHAAVPAFLHQELDTPALDALHPHLWAAATRSGSHVDNLHTHQIRGREVVPCEATKLHMVWVPQRVFLKPVPRCLLNYYFWKTFLPGDGDVPESAKPMELFNRRIALGFMRSYCYLIKSPLDFEIAVEKKLIPKDIKWKAWSKFIGRFRGLWDAEVGKRYHYGQLRMSRLHWVKRMWGASIKIPRDNTTWWFYEVPLWSTMDYINAAFAPLLFLFASMSLALSSMQVVLTTPPNADFAGGLSDASVRAVQKAFFGFSTAVIFISGLTWLLFLLIPAIVLLWQFQFGFRSRKKAIDGDQRDEKSTHIAQQGRFISNLRCSSHAKILYPQQCDNVAMQLNRAVLHISKISSKECPQTNVDRTRRPGP